MQWTRVLMVATGFVVACCALAATSQPPDGKGPGKGPPPKKYMPGKVMPPHIRDGLDLTADQERKLHALEKEVRTRILDLLTAEQREKLEELCDRPPPPPHGRKKRPDAEDGKDRPAAGCGERPVGNPW